MMAHAKRDERSSAVTECSWRASISFALRCTMACGMLRKLQCTIATGVEFPLVCVAIWYDRLAGCGTCSKTSWHEANTLFTALRMRIQRGSRVSRSHEYVVLAGVRLMRASQQCPTCVPSGHLASSASCGGASAAKLNCLTHARCPARGCVCPNGHAVHSRCPACEAKRPGTHSMQA